MKVVRSDIWLCQDCMIAAINGDLPPDNTPEQDAVIEAGLTRLGHGLVNDFNGEDGTGEVDFSLIICDCCETQLAGARFRFAILGEG